VQVWLIAAGDGIGRATGCPAAKVFEHARTRVRIHDQYLRRQLAHKAVREMDRYRGLSHAALLVGYCNDGHARNISEGVEDEKCLSGYPHRALLIAVLIARLLSSYHAGRGVQRVESEVRI
jgi:hypothetical protein